ncbi:hypothetical protein KCP75_07590 [Salmonella enterica subsp. enterica]|nr:hypothetical protein KCP75_07590 [Salmonella enterica subsp. enterica]
MLRTLIKVTFGYPAIFDEGFRQECQINNAHVVAGCMDPGIKAFIAVVRLQNISPRKAADGAPAGKTCATNRSQWPVFYACVACAA